MIYSPLELLVRVNNSFRFKKLKKVVEIHIQNLNNCITISRKLLNRLKSQRMIKMEVQLSDEGRGDRIQNSELTYGREGERRNLPKDLKHRSSRTTTRKFVVYSTV